MDMISHDACECNDSLVVQEIKRRHCSRPNRQSLFVVASRPHRYTERLRSHYYDRITMDLPPSRGFGVVWVVFDRALVLPLMQNVYSPPGPLAKIVLKFVEM